MTEDVSNDECSVYGWDKPAIKGDCMTGARKKSRAIFMAAIMLTSMVAMSAAIAGPVAAANSSAGFNAPLPAGTVTDNTPDSTTTFGSDSTIANVSFGSAGDVSNITVDANSSDEGDVSPSSIDRVTVTLFNGSGDVLETKEETYDDHGTLVEFNGSGNVSDVSRFVVVATLADSNSLINGETIDANVTVQTNPTGFVETANTQTVTTDNGFFSGRVSEAESNRDVDAATVLVENTTTGFSKTTETNSEGEYTISVPAGTYTVTADAPGFKTASPKDGVVNQAEATSANFVIERQVQADNLEVTEPTGGSTVVDIGENFDATVLVESLDAESPFDELSALEGENVEASNVTVEFDNPNDLSATLDINPNTNETNADGETQFNIGLDLQGNDAEDFDENIEAQIRFDATTSSESDTLNVTFLGEPPSGDGVIQGDVNEISDGVEVGAQNANRAEGVTVHAVRFDRLDENSIAGTGLGATYSTTNATLDVAGDDTEYVRTVVQNTTSGEVNEVLDVETDYLFKTDSVSASQNLSIPGTGFNAEDTDGNGGAFAVHVLESNEELDGDESYAVEISGDGNFTSANTVVTFDAPNDLTYDGIETRYEGISQPTDETGQFGEYNLQNLYTNGEEGADYVVIAGDGNADLGFANAQAYDLVNVQQSSSANDAQLSTSLNVKQVNIQADSVNVTNVGTLSDAADADADYEDADSYKEFDDQSDEVRQEIPRDGSTVDVIDLTTFFENEDTPVGENVTVSVDNIETGDFEGAFLSNVVGGELISVDNSANAQEITINTEDGNAVIFLESDSVNADTNVTISAENEGVGTDSTDKRFTEVVNADFETGELSGIVTDSNNREVAATVYSEEIDISEYASNLELLVSPVDADDLDGNWTVTLNDSSGAGVIEEHEISRDDAESYDFAEFDEDLNVADAGGITLVTETGGDASYTMSNVIADSTIAGAGHRVVGVDSNGQTGAATEGVTIGTTGTANIVVPGAASASFTVSDLEPENPEVEQGTLIDVNATVTNDGAVTGTKDVEFRIDGTAERTSQVTLEGGESTTVEFNDIDTSGLAEGEYTHGVFTEDDDHTGTLNITVEEATETPDGLSRFDENSNGQIDRPEAISAVIARNTGGTIGDQPVDRDTAVNVIIAYNTGQSIEA